MIIKQNCFFGLFKTVVSLIDFVEYFSKYGPKIEEREIYEKAKWIGKGGKERMESE